MEGLCCTSRLLGRFSRIYDICLNRNLVLVESISTYIWYDDTYDSFVLRSGEGANVHIHLKTIIYAAAKTFYFQSTYVVTYARIEKVHISSIRNQS
jgi:hypothetical protein